MLKSLIIAILLTATTYSFGQGCFFADDTVGCVPFTVHLTNCGAQNTAVIYYLGNDITSCSFNGRQCDDTTFTFTQAGTYSITQQPSGQSAETRTDYIRAVSNPVPQFSLATCENGDVFISIDESVFDHYVVDYGDGSPNDTLDPSSTIIKTYTTVTPKTITVIGIYDYTDCSNSNSKNITPVISYIQKPGLLSVTGISTGVAEAFLTGQSGLMYYSSVRIGPSGSPTNSSSFMISSSDSTIQFNGIDESTCYTVTNFDQCGNEIISDMICSIGINALAINNQNDIDWDFYPTGDLDEFTLFKNDVGIVQGTGTSYNDTDVLCAQEYCYFQRAQLNQTVDGQQIYYQTPAACVTSFSSDTPPAISQIVASVNSDNTTELIFSTPIGWDTTSVFSPASLSLEYGNDTSNYFGSNESSPATFETSMLFINPSIEIGCYRLNYTDACGNMSNTENGPEACAILLSGIRLQTGGYTLSWTDHFGFSSGNNSYTLEWLDDNDVVFQETSLGLLNSYTDITPPTSVQTLRYRVRANSNDGQIAYSNIVEFTQRAVVFFPTGFSPNGDGQNDEFKPVGLFVQSFEMYVFNRWGETIFFSDNIDVGWDGKYKNKEVINGVYVYKTTYTDQNGNEITKKGTIAVIY